MQGGRYHVNLDHIFQVSEIADARADNPQHSCGLARMSAGGDMRDAADASRLAIRKEP